MELLIATAAEAADMLGVSRSRVYGLIAAKPLGSSRSAARGAYRSPRSAMSQPRARGWNLLRRALSDPANRRRRRSRRRWAMCSRHDPLWTTADVAAF